MSMVLRDRLGLAFSFWRMPAFLLLGWGLRLHRLGDSNVWWDEGLAVWAARQPLAQMAQWTASDVHPPLYFALLHFWRLIAGESEWGLRLLSAIVGTVTIAGIYLLGQKVGRKRVGWLAALLLTISRFAIDWSQQMRMYALAALLATFALWAALQIWQKGRWHYWLLYLAAIVGGLYSLYLFALLWGAINLVWAGVLLGKKPLAHLAEIGKWIAGQLLILGLFVPWLFYALEHIPTWSSASPVSLVDFLQIYGVVLTVGIPLQVSQFAPLTVPAFLLLGIGWWLIWQQSDFSGRTALLLLTVVLLLPAGVVYLVSLPQNPFFYSPQLAPRYLLIFISSYGVLMGWGVAAIYRKWKSAGIFAGLFIIGTALYGLQEYHSSRIRRDDYASLVATLQAYVQPEDAVLLHTDTDWPIFAYYYNAPWSGISNTWHLTPQQAQQYLAPIWQKQSAVWLVLTPYAAVSDPQNSIANWLQTQAAATQTYRYGDKQLVLFSRTPERTATMDQLNGSLPNKELSFAPLVGYNQPILDFGSGETARLFLFWQGSGQPFPLKTGLIDDMGQRWQEQEQQVQLFSDDQMGRSQVDLYISPDMPAGIYQFYATFLNYEQVQLGKVQIHTSSKPVLTLAEVQIRQLLTVQFDAGIHLLGYDLAHTSYTPGQQIPLTLFWQAAQPVPQRYKIFTHLLGENYNAQTDNFLWGQQDNEPVNNSRPVTSWRTGEVVIDSYAIPIDPLAPAGIYTLEIGWYDPITGSRLPILDSSGTPISDHLILTTVQIGK